MEKFGYWNIEKSFALQLFGTDSPLKRSNSPSLITDHSDFPSLIKVTRKSKKSASSEILVYQWRIINPNYQIRKYTLTL